MCAGVEEGRNEEKQSQILYFVSLWCYGCKFSIIAVLYFENRLSHPEHNSDKCLSRVMSKLPNPHLWFTLRSHFLKKRSLNISSGVNLSVLTTTKKSDLVTSACSVNVP